AMDTFPGDRLVLAADHPFQEGHPHPLGVRGAEARASPLVEHFKGNLHRSASRWRWDNKPRRVLRLGPDPQHPPPPPPPPRPPPAGTAAAGRAARRARGRAFPPAPRTPSSASGPCTSA